MARIDDQRHLAGHVAAAADLKEVRLFNVDASLDQLPAGPGALGFDYGANVEVQQVLETNSLIVDGDYRLVVHFIPEGSDLTEVHTSDAVADDSDDEHSHVAHLNFRLAALYTLPDDGDSGGFPEDQLDAFGQTTGVLTLHPYAREFVSSMTGRMGLPPLHLGTMRLRIDKFDDR